MYSTNVVSRRHKGKKVNSGLYHRVALYRGVFVSAFPALKELHRVVKITSDAICFPTVDLGPIQLPEEVQRFDVELDLREGKFVGLNYSFLPEGGWVVAVYSREGSEKKWGHIYAEVLGALYHGLDEDKEFAQQVSHMYHFFADSDWNLAAGQILLHGRKFVIPPRITMSVCGSLEKVEPVKFESRTYSLH